MEVFPHFFIRTSSYSVDQIWNNNLGYIIQEYEQYLTFKTKIDAIKSQMINKAFDLIKAADSNNFRLKLLEFKRNIYNGRHLEKIILNTEIFQLFEDDLTEFFALKKKALEIEEKLSIEFKKGKEIEQNNLDKFAENPIIQAGLLLSSKSLYDAIKKKNSVKPNARKRHQLYLGLIKYASRVCAKTTPFGTFTSFGHARFEKEELNQTKILGEVETHTKSYTRLNSSILSQLIILFLTNKVLRKEMYVTLNPSILFNENAYKFFKNKYGIEIFQDLKSKKNITTLVGILKKRKRIKYIDLIKKFLLITNSSENDIDYFLIELIQIGFIEVHFEIKAIQFWQNDLLASLEKYPIDLSISKVITFLKLSEFEYKTKDIDKREDIQKKLYSLYKEIVDLFVKTSDFETTINKPDGGISFKKKRNDKIVAEFEIFPLRIENLLYEDLRRDFTLNLSSKELQRTLENVKIFFDEMFLFRNTRSENTILEKFYMENYNGKEVPLAQFYQAFIKDLFKNDPSANKLTQLEDYPSRYLKDKNLYLWGEAFELLLKKKGVKNNELNLDLEDLSNINTSIGISENHPKTRNSFSFLSHFYIHHHSERKPQLIFVVNVISVGFGKLFSRFLPLLDENVLADLKLHNHRLKQKNEIFFEMTDSSINNLNIRLPILDKELKFPCSINNFPKEKLIDVSKIFIVMEDKSRKLELREESSRHRLIPFNLSVQSLRTRSRFYNFLNNFTCSEGLSNSSFLPIINRNFKEIESNPDFYPECFKIFPRITISQSIVVQKKKWLFRNWAFFIEKTIADDELNKFFVVNKWRMKIGMPDEVFYRPVLVEKMGNVDIRSQYINFNSPLLVILFLKLINKNSCPFSLEEMLPNTEQLMEVMGKKYSAELLLQWNVYGK